MAKGAAGETLISFESGHYKKVKGRWAGDSVWSHFIKDSGGIVHVNKDKAEYIETFEDSGDGSKPVQQDDKKVRSNLRKST